MQILDLLSTYYPFKRVPSTPSIGEGSPVDATFHVLKAQAKKRKDNPGKVYNFFHKIFVPPHIRKKTTAQIVSTLQYLEYERDIDRINRVFEVIAQFRTDEFDRRLIPQSLKNRLLEEVEGTSVISKIAQVSVWLGIQPLLNGKGSHSSKIYFNLTQRPIAIYKSGDPLKEENLKRKLAIILNQLKIIRIQDFFLPLPDQRPAGAMISERATYRFVQELGLDLVPTTEIVEMDGAKGSFQHFVQGYREAAEVRLPSSKEANKEDLQKFQIFAIIDYLIGSLDRKEANWLVQLDEEGHIRDIKMIDNGNNFTTEHLPKSARIALKNQYLWKKLQLARAPLSEETKEFIRGLTEERIDHVIKTIKAEFGEMGDAFFSEPVMRTLKDRLAIIRSFADSERTLVDLAKLGTAEAIAAAIPQNYEPI